MQTTGSSGLLPRFHLVLSALFVLLLVAPPAVALAQEVGSAAWERLRFLARELDSLSEHAAERSKEEARNDVERELADAVEDFSNEADDLEDRFDGMTIDDDEVGEELQRLANMAHRVVPIALRADRQGAPIVAHWNRVVSVLNEMTSIYRAANGLAPLPPIAAAGVQVGTYQQAPPTTIVIERQRSEGSVGTTGTPVSRTRREIRTVDIAYAVDFAREVERRADRAAVAADRAGMDSAEEALEDLRDDAREFARHWDGAVGPAGEFNDQIDDLLDSADEARRTFRLRDAPADLIREWNAITDLLLRLRDGT
ncbi:MAG: hypothetical protein EHM13_01385 [Acidobacteria bacterium]|nr:MAG: hypothetical protein EHM13_01385 [Acidobacteriota bacterium]